MTPEERTRLNELLAEHVMEWKRGVMTTFNRTMTFFYDEDADKTYTSDELTFLTWEGMGIIITEMREKGWFFYGTNADDEGKSRATFCEDREFIDGPIGTATAEDLRQATALAALNALSVGV